MKDNIVTTMYDYSRNGRIYSSPSMQFAVARTDAETLTEITSTREVSGRLTSTSQVMVVEK